LQADALQAVQDAQQCNNDNCSLTDALKSMFKRMFTSATIGYTLILGACIGLGVLYFILRYFIGGTLGGVLRQIFGRCRECLCTKAKAQTEDKSDAALKTTFREMEKLMQQHKIITSYSARKNPRYGRFVRSLDQQGAIKAGEEPAQEEDAFYEADAFFLTDM
jgi:hypothetical protein